MLAEIHEFQREPSPTHRKSTCGITWLTGRQYLNLAGWKEQVEQSFPKGPKGNYRKTVA